jgi:hypothetical protein
MPHLTIGIYWGYNIFYFFYVLRILLLISGGIIFRLPLPGG